MDNRFRRNPPLVTCAPVDRRAVLSTAPMYRAPRHLCTANQFRCPVLGGFGLSEFSLVEGGNINTIPKRTRSITSSSHQHQQHHTQQQKDHQAQQWPPVNSSDLSLPPLPQRSSLLSNFTASMVLTQLLSSPQLQRTLPLRRLSNPCKS
jgi:hypothetical protein